MKRRSPVLAVALAGPSWSMAPAAHAGCGGVQVRHAQHKRDKGRAPLVVGHAVPLGAMREATAGGLDLNAHGSRISW